MSIHRYPFFSDRLIMLSCALGITVALWWHWAFLPFVARNQEYRKQIHELQEARDSTRMHCLADQQRQNADLFLSRALRTIRTQLECTAPLSHLLQTLVDRDIVLASFIPAPPITRSGLHKHRFQAELRGKEVSLLQFLAQCLSFNYYIEELALHSFSHDSLALTCTLAWYTQDGSLRHKQQSPALALPLQTLFSHDTEHTSPHAATDALHLNGTLSGAHDQKAIISYKEKTFIVGVNDWIDNHKIVAITEDSAIVQTKDGQTYTLS